MNQGGVRKFYTDKQGNKYELDMTESGSLTIRKSTYVDGEGETLSPRFHIGKKDEWTFKLLIDKAKGVLTVINKKGDEYSASIPHLFNKLERQSMELNQ